MIFSISEDLHIIQLDNGSFHTTPKLKVPENIILLFQPAHCPELNPIERLWEHLKDCLAWQLFNNLDALKVQSETSSTHGVQNQKFDRLGLYSSLYL